MLEGMASGLPPDDRGAPALRGGAVPSSRVSPPSPAAHYEGSHWLGRSAVYALTGRG